MEICQSSEKKGIDADLEERRRVCLKSSFFFSLFFVVRCNVKLKKFNPLDLGKI